MENIDVLIQDIIDWYYMNQPDIISEQELNDLVTTLTKISEEEKRLEDDDYEN